MRSRDAVMAVIALVVLGGCNRIERSAVTGERADAMYREAMAEYSAGNLRKAIAKFEKVVAASPGNASARFQLACLQQDDGSDLLGAVCNYREYLAQAPNDDKVEIAKRRMEETRRKMATEMMKAYGLGGSVAQDEEISRLRKDKAQLSEKLQTATKELEQLKLDFAAARRENDRIRKMVLAGGEDAAAPVRPSVPSTPVSEKDLLEDDSGVVDRVKFSADVANLIAEEKSETVASPFGKTVRKPKEAQSDKPVGPPHEPRPEYYVVEEGDTLYKLALRFYGKRSAWSDIREANKAIISTDGRIRAGQRLRLP